MAVECNCDMYTGTFGCMKLTRCVCREKFLLGVWVYEIGDDHVCWWRWGFLWLCYRTQLHSYCACIVRKRACWSIIILIAVINRLTIVKRASIDVNSQTINRISYVTIYSKLKLKNSNWLGEFIYKAGRCCCEILWRNLKWWCASYTLSACKWNINNVQWGIIAVDHFQLMSRELKNLKHKHVYHWVDLLLLDERYSPPQLADWTSC